jgi:hypothetical protein
MATEVEILASLCVGHSFGNWDEVLQLEKNLRDVCFMPIIRKDSRSVKSHNEKVHKLLHYDYFNNEI